MNVPDCVDCHSCGNPVKPVRKKVPRTNIENVSPMLEFGWYCPVKECGVRLDKTIAKIEHDPSAEVEPFDGNLSDIPEDILPMLEGLDPQKPTAKAIATVRPAKTKESEDLFARIQREHEEAVREEAELTARLAHVTARRERLDRLVIAIENECLPVAAE